MKHIYSFVNDHKLFQIHKQQTDKRKAFFLSSYKVSINGKAIDVYIDLSDPNTILYRSTFMNYNKENAWRDFYSNIISDYEADLIEKFIYNDLFRMKEDDFKKIIYFDNDYYLNVFNEFYIKIEHPKTFCKVFPKYKFILQ